MEKQNTRNEDTSWLEGIDSEKVKKAAACEILPKRDLPKVGEVLQVKILELPKKVEHEKLPDRKAFFGKVEFARAEMTMCFPKSLRFSMAAELEKDNGSCLVGQTFTIGAKIDDIGYGPDTKLYWAQLRNTELKGVEQ